MNTSTTTPPLLIEPSAKEYFLQHPGAERLMQHLLAEAREAFGPYARLRVELYRDHENGDLTPWIFVDAGLSFDATRKVIDELLNKLDRAESLVEPEEYVSISPEDYLLAG